MGALGLCLSHNKCSNTVGQTLGQQAGVAPLCQVLVQRSPLPFRSAFSSCEIPALIIRSAAAAASKSEGGGWWSGGGSGGGGSGPGRSEGAGDWQPRQHSYGVGQVLALAATAYMLLALFQPWRLLSGLPSLDTSSATVSIIIPVLNEAEGIAATLQKLKQLQPPAAELIVVDGGSTDGTVTATRKSGLADKVLKSGRGRAVQMNAGAKSAKGDLLCFLHADTQPPSDLVSVMRQELTDPHTVLGGFVPSIEVPGRRLWLLSFHNFISTYYAPLLFRPAAFLRGLRNLFGDQTMFCRACDFKSVGGFDTQWTIMEDTDLCVRMHEAGPCRHSTTGSLSQPRLRSMLPPAAGAGRKHKQQTQQQQQQQQQESQHCQLQQGGGVQQLQQHWQQWLRPRGRVKQVLNRLSVTSGRRLDAWGPLRATYIHVVIGASWYFRRDPVELKELYTLLYTDAFR